MPRVATSPGKTRLAAWLPLGLAVLLLLFFGREGLSAAYDQVARTASERNGASARALHAGAYATRLAPWSAWRQRGYAWTLALASDRPAYDQHIHAALRWAPADPYIWNLHANALMQQGDFGAETAHAAARMNRLAPHTPPLQAQQALLATFYWPRATSELREEWLRSSEYMLRLHRMPYLNEVLRRGRAPHFCAYMAAELGAAGWCDRAAEAMQACASPRLRPGQRRWCERMNLLP